MKDLAAVFSKTNKSSCMLLCTELWWY